MGLSLIEIPLKCAFVTALSLRRQSSGAETARTSTVSFSELLTEIHSTHFANFRRATGCDRIPDRERSAGPGVWVVEKES
jgi:hypothetical protein